MSGKDTANPTAFIRASIDMLRYLELHKHANTLSDALYYVLNVENVHTPDIGGTNKSSEVVEAVIKHLKKIF